MERTVPLSAQPQALDYSKESRSALGAVYTPPALAAWLASEVLSRLTSVEPIRILDPACGDGALLRAVQNLSSNNVQLIGTDVDDEALSLARAALGGDARLTCVDALMPGGGHEAPVLGWESLLGAAPLSAVIANPPWGARLACKPGGLRELGYQLANGQFDSYELFIELCLALVPDGAILGFIVPDSVFLPQHARLRRMLLGCTRLELIARLGEGIFPGVYRGVVVIVVRKGQATADHFVGCLRLSQPWRQRILAGKATYQQASKELIHEVPQSRFFSDREARFDIDLPDDELRTYARLHNARAPWTSYVRSGRGIELSKHGYVVVCPECGEAKARPRSDDLGLCRSCGLGLAHSGATAEQIVRTERPVISDGWARLIVGEDVDRYRCVPSRWIRTGLSGINYKKPEEFGQPKLLVRKTGVGLKAAIDESGAHTNQVVFHYVLDRRQDLPSFYLDYLLGVLCSRTLLAYHLRRAGETEWRSHPYVTQSVIAELPVPRIDGGNWAQAQAIAAAAQRCRNAKGDLRREDLCVEHLVAGLFGLDPIDCAWVGRVLDEAEGLEPIRTLRLFPSEQIIPIRV